MDRCCQIIAPFLFGAVLLVAGFAEEPASDKVDTDAALAILQRQVEPLSDPDAMRERVEQLVGSLDSDEFIEREKAVRKLSELPPRIKPILKAAAKGRSQEVVTRSKTVLRKLDERARAEANLAGGAIDDLIAAGDRRVVPLLLDLLESGDRTMRNFAAHGLRQASGKEFGFDAAGTPRERRMAIREFRGWWSESKDSFKFSDAARALSRLGVLIANDVSKEIVLIDLKGKVLWQRSVDLDIKAASLLPNGHYLVAHDMGACEFDRQHKKVWDTSKSGLGNTMIYDVSRLKSGNTLLCYVSDGHVTELDPAGRVVWQIEGLSSPGAAERLTNGNTLICENHANRIIEVSRDKETVWEFGDLKNPSGVSSLASGSILVAEWGSKRAFEVTREKDVVWKHEIDAEVSTVSRLPDGNTIVAREGSITLADRRGKLVREIFQCDRRYGKASVVPIPKVLPKP